MADPLIPPARNEILTKDGELTLRATKFFEALSSISNETSSTINTSTDIETLALIADINNRLGSGDALTSDSDSFTVDSTILFVDLTEA